MKSYHLREPPPPSPAAKYVGRHDTSPPTHNQPPLPSHLFSGPRRRPPLPYLNDDLIAGILLHLPAPSVARFRSVSNRWLSISSYFTPNSSEPTASATTLPRDTSSPSASAKAPTFLWIPLVLHPTLFLPGIVTPTPILHIHMWVDGDIVRLDVLPICRGLERVVIPTTLANPEGGVLASTSFDVFEMETVGAEWSVLHHVDLGAIHEVYPVLDKMKKWRHSLPKWSMDGGTSIRMHCLSLISLCKDNLKL